MTKTLLPTIFVALAVCAVALFTASAVQAHKIRVFAYENDGDILCEVKFANDRPAKNVPVIVEKNDGTSLLSGMTDERGEFRFTVPQEILTQGPDLHIIADVGEGHRGSWLLEAADYLAELPSPQQAAPPSEPTSGAGAVDNAGPAAHDQELEKRVEKIIRKELLPIKRMLTQEREKRLTLQDILGGLGYIFGLAGIAAYYKSKSNGGKS